MEKSSSITCEEYLDDELESCFPNFNDNYEIQTKQFFEI